MDTVLNYINCFFVYAFAGWVLESLFGSLIKRKFINRGFLRGCFCPIYGFGAFIAIFSFKAAKMLALSHPAIMVTGGILISILLATLLEYISGVLLDRVFGQRYWDYSENFANIHGYVCLKYSLLWGVLAFVIAKIIHPDVSYAFLFVPAKAKAVISFALILYFLADFLTTGASILKKDYESEKEIFKNDYERCVSDLIAHPNVISMSAYIQHGNTSCLQHSKHVSYDSYVICRLLKLDFRSAARGGLLHDYFLYDWHINSPCRFHGLRHPHYALVNAKRDFLLSETECDIIEKHMWPLTAKLPKYKVSFMVSMVDKVCTVAEVFHSKANENYRYQKIKKYIHIILER